MTIKKKESILMQLQVSDRIPYGNVAAVESGVADGNNHIAFTAAAHGVGIETCLDHVGRVARGIPPRDPL